MTLLQLKQLINNIPDEYLNSHVCILTKAEILDCAKVVYEIENEGPTVSIHAS